MFPYLSQVFFFFSSLLGRTTLTAILIVNRCHKALPRCVKPPYVSWYKLLSVVFCLDLDFFFFFSCSLVGCFSFTYLFIYLFIKRKWDIKHGEPKETPNILLSFDWVQKMDLAPSMWTLHGGWPRQPLKETLVSILGLCKVSLLYTSGPLGLAQWSVDLPIKSPSKQRSGGPKVRTEHVWVG